MTVEQHTHHTPHHDSPLSEGRKEPIMAKTNTAQLNKAQTTTNTKENKAMSAKKPATNNKKAKVNWGVLRDDKHKDVLKGIAKWKALRDQMAKDQENRNNDLTLLRAEDAFKGNLIDKTWVCLDKEQQVMYNLKEDQLKVKYRELAKKRKADLEKIYQPLFGNSLFESYLAYIAVDASEEAKANYLKEIETFLKVGIRVPFGEKGLRYAAEELVKGIGKQVLGIRAAYRLDQDAIPYKEPQFYNAVMANFRSILQEVGIIDCKPIETPKKGKEPAKESPKEEQPLLNLPAEEIQEAVQELETAAGIDVESLIAEAPAKPKANRNRGVRSKAKSKSKSEVEIELEECPFV